MSDILERLHAIARITRRTIGSVPLAQHAREMTEQVRKLFDMDACVIRLLDGQDAVLLASSGLPEKNCHPRIPVNYGISREVFRKGAALFIPDVAEHPATAGMQTRMPNSFLFTSYAGAPMLAGDRVIGILGLYSVSRRASFEQSDLDCIQIMANSMSVAIANDGVYEQLLYEHEQLESEMASRKQAEARLAESEERLRLAVAASRMFAFEWDPATDQVMRSPESADILGVTGDPTRDTGRDFFARIHPDDRGRFVSMLTDLSRNSPEYKTTYRYIRGDGRVAWLEETARAFFDAQGKLSRLIGMTSDISETFRARQEALRLREDLARVGRVAAMGELSATLAHELNQPLGAISVNATVCERLLNGSNPDLGEVRQALNWIGRDALRAADVIRRVRDFLSRGRAERGSLNLNEVISTVADLARHRIVTAEVELALHLEPKLLTIAGDRTQLQQLILNLLTNAVEAVLPVEVSRRKVTITSRWEADSVRVAVEDSGIGVSPEDVDRVFRPFFTTKSEGMGMGLAICRSIVEAHGGRLWMEPNPAGGSRFQFTLPAT